MPFLIALVAWEQKRKSNPKYSPDQFRDYGEISIRASVDGYRTRLSLVAQTKSPTLMVVRPEAISNVPDRLDEPMLHVVDLAA